MIPKPTYYTVPVPPPPTLTRPTVELLPLTIPDTPSTQSAMSPTAPQRPQVGASATLTTITIDEITESVDASILSFLNSLSFEHGWNVSKSMILRKYLAEKEKILSQAAALGHYTLSGHYQKMLYLLSANEAEELHQEFIKYVLETYDILLKGLGQVLRAILNIEEDKIKNWGLQQKIDMQYAMTVLEVSLANVDAQIEASKEYVQQLVTYIQGKAEAQEAFNQQYELEAAHLEGLKYEALNEQLGVQKDIASLRLLSLEAQLEAIKARAVLLENQLNIIGGELYKVEVEQILALVKEQSALVQIAEAQSKINVAKAEAFKTKVQAAQVAIKSKAVALEAQIKSYMSEMESLKTLYELTLEKIRLHEKKITSKNQVVVAKLEKEEARVEETLSRYKERLFDIKLDETDRAADSRISVIRRSIEAATRGETASAVVRARAQALAAADDAQMSAGAAEIIGSINRAAQIRARLIHVLGGGE